MKLIAVIGAGSWGTALSVMAGRAGHEVRIWARNESIVESINRDHVNSKYLSDLRIPERVVATSKFEWALNGSDVAILAAPSHTVRALLESMSPALGKRTVLVSATKGIESTTGKRMSEIVAEILGADAAAKFTCLSGPSFAKEVVAGHPTAIVAASLDAESRSLVQAELSFDNLRIYTNDDLIGTELGGSVKNVMAIAAGIVSGLEMGYNSIAALITRGLAETTRLAVRAGSRVETLTGLAGLGDLVLTCTGGLSRNRYVGQELGRGRSLNEVVGSMSEVAEGINTTRAVRLLAQKFDVEMPITEQVYRVLYEGKSPRDAAAELMNRPLRVES